MIKDALKAGLGRLAGAPYAPKAAGPFLNVVGEMDAGLIGEAVRELGDPEGWPESARDKIPALSYGRSLLLRREDHRDTRRRAAYPAVNAIVERVTRLGYGEHPGKIMAAYLPPHGRIGAHWDSAQYYRYHNRIHVPLVTNPGVVMTTRDTDYHMDVGKVYLYQNLETHAVANHSDQGRIHLIFDLLDPRYSEAVFTRLYPLWQRNLLGAGSLYRALAFVRHSSRR